MSPHLVGSYKYVHNMTSDYDRHHPELRPQTQWWYTTAVSSFANTNIKDKLRFHLLPKPRKLLLNTNASKFRTAKL